MPSISTVINGMIFECEYTGTTITHINVEIIADTLIIPTTIDSITFTGINHDALGGFNPGSAPLGGPDEIYTMLPVVGNNGQFTIVSSSTPPWNPQIVYSDQINTFNGFTYATTNGALLAIDFASVTLTDNTLEIPASIDGTAITKFFPLGEVNNIDIHKIVAEPNNSITTIPKDFLEDSEATEIDLSGLTGLTTIEYSSLQSHSDLVTLSLPASVTTIGMHAFSGAKALAVSPIFPHDTQLSSLGPHVFLHSLIANHASYDSDNSAWQTSDGEKPAWLQALIAPAPATGSGDPYISPFFVI